MKAMKCSVSEKALLRSEIDPERLLSLCEFRANMYRFFSSVYNHPMDQGMVESFLGEDFMELAEEFSSADSILLLKQAVQDFDNDLDELRYEYNNLFIVPGGQFVTPCESVYRGTRMENGREVLGLLNGPETIEVRRTYQSLGLDLDKKKIGPPDFVGTEMEFMYQAAVMEQEAWEANNQDRAHFLLKVQKDFVERHLSQWIPAICKKITERTRSPLYQCIAAITRDFILIEAETFSQIFE